MELYSSHTCFCLTSPSLCLLPSAAWHRGSSRETRPTGASVSSCWIGNLALTALKYEPQDASNKPYRPLMRLLDGEPSLPGGHYSDL